MLKFIFTGVDISSDQTELPAKCNVYDELKIIFHDHKNIMK